MCSKKKPDGFRAFKTLMTKGPLKGANTLAMVCYRGHKSLFYEEEIESIIRHVGLCGW